MSLLQVKVIVLVRIMKNIFFLNFMLTRLTIFVTWDSGIAYFMLWSNMLMALWDGLYLWIVWDSIFRFSEALSGNFSGCAEREILDPAPSTWASFTRVKKFNNLQLHVKVCWFFLFFWLSLRVDACCVISEAQKLVLFHVCSGLNQFVTVVVVTMTLMKLFHAILPL